MAHITKSQLIRLQKKYKRDQLIGDQFGITRQAIHQMRKKYGIPSVEIQIPERNKKMRAMRKQGKSIAVIAGKFDLAMSYVYRIVQGSK